MLKWFRRKSKETPAGALSETSGADEFEPVAQPVPEADGGTLKEADFSVEIAPEPGAEIESFTFDKSLFTGDASEEISAELQAFDASLGIEDFSPDTAPAIFSRE